MNNMKRIALFAVVIMLIGFAGVNESQAGRFEKRYSRQHDRTENYRPGAMHDRNFSRSERIRFEHRQDLARRHNIRMRHNDRNRYARDRYRYDHVSVRSSAVVLPLLLPPLPPLPLVFPGMNIRIFSSR